MRIAISAGHGGKDPGTVNPRLGLQEHAEALTVAEELHGHLSAAGVHTFFVEPGRFTLDEKIREVNESHRGFPFDWAIEIHFNSAENDDAHGTEVWHWSMKNAAMAARMSAAISRRIGTKDRGAKHGSLKWTRLTAPPALLVECLFLNNDDEAQKVKAPTFAKHVAAGIVEALFQ